MKFKYPEGATPIDLNEANGLIPDIYTQKELNAMEAANILKAQLWCLSRRKQDWLTVRYFQQVHKKMFSDVWEWAGDFRRTEKSIGVDKFQISTELLNLVKDTQYWLDNESFSYPELSVRFHHRLVKIHPFVNGNGRHSRMMANVLLYQKEQKLLSWGGGSFQDGQLRKDYIAALKKMDIDSNDNAELIRIACS